MKTIKRVSRSSQNTFDSLTKWLVYLSLVVSGISLLVDLVIIIVSWLNGELTERTLFKAVSFLLIVGSAFYFYKAQVTETNTNKNFSKIFLFWSILLVAISLLFAFNYLEPPAEVRGRKLDQAQIYHLQDLHTQIRNYVLTNEKLPATLQDISGSIPTAPTGRKPYRYLPTDGGFKLCATFAYDSKSSKNLPTPTPFPVVEKNLFNINDSTIVYVKMIDDWRQYQAGETCFESELIFKDSQNNKEQKTS